MTPLEAMALAINHWEGLFEANPNDTGNYVTLPDGTKKLVGTMRGVTPEAYANYAGIDPTTLTADQMKNNVTADVAAAIGIAKYYKNTGLDLLPWSQLIAIALDWGWGSGPITAVKHLQRLVNVDDDGEVGPATINAVNSYITQNSLKVACDNFTDARCKFYNTLVQSRPSNGVFLKGWLNRANWYRSTGDWFSKWN